jgi:hypothetical protein
MSKLLVTLFAGLFAATVFAADAGLPESQAADQSAAVVKPSPKARKKAVKKAPKKAPAKKAPRKAKPAA